MPITVILLIVFAVTLTSWVAASRHTRRAARASRREELSRLRHQALWLEQRLDIARRERWDPAMVTNLSEQLGIACHNLAQAQLRARAPVVAKTS